MQACATSSASQLPRAVIAPEQQSNSLEKPQFLCSAQLRRDFEGGSEAVRPTLVRRTVEVTLFVRNQIAE